jgi:hypothetical protein
MILVLSEAERRGLTLPGLHLDTKRKPVPVSGGEWPSVVVLTGYDLDKVRGFWVPSLSFHRETVTERSVVVHVRLGNVFLYYR